MNREWSGQYKIQYFTQTPSSSAPDVQEGDRFTESLTKRVVSKIFGGMEEGDAAPYSTLPEPPLLASKTRGPRSMLRGRPQLKGTGGTNTPINIKRSMVKSVDHIAGPYPQYSPNQKKNSH